MINHRQLAAKIAAKTNDFLEDMFNYHAEWEFKQTDAVQVIDGKTKHFRGTMFRPVFKTGRLLLWKMPEERQDPISSRWTELRVHFWFGAAKYWLTAWTTEERLSDEFEFAVNGDTFHIIRRKPQ